MNPNFKVYQYEPQERKRLVDLLKEVLSQPTTTYNEDVLVDWLMNYGISKGYKTQIDDSGNVYMTKGNADVYPCLIAHTDTVHKIHYNENKEIQHIQIIEEMDRLFAIPFDADPTDRKYLKRCGCGGDDKAGVFLCLAIAEKIENIKLAFFVSEEYGCIGSHKNYKPFFNDVGYAIQYDCPETNGVSFSCSGVQLFNPEGQFFTILYPILGATIGENFSLFKHPYTDIYVIKSQNDIATINLPTAYYNYHTKYEFIDIKEILTLIKTNVDIINALGNKRYREPKGEETYSIFPYQFTKNINESQFYIKNNFVSKWSNYRIDQVDKNITSKAIVKVIPENANNNNEK